MEIKQLKIQNYKSIEKIELESLTAFSVFVGPNASGKSNIFESIEFLNIYTKTSNSSDTIRLFGKPEDIFNKKSNYAIDISFQLINDIKPTVTLYARTKSKDSPVSVFKSSQDFESLIFHSKDQNINGLKKLDILEFEELKRFYNFTRLFINNPKIKRNNYLDDSKLNADASNLESVLKRVLKNENKRSMILEELSLLIPGFENIEIRSDEVSGTDSLLIFEKGSDIPFNKHLISDGTYNIIALLTAVYQSDDGPQFLCIEEPENGLNPFVAREFVRIFRNACEDFGHFIWINTHSQSILSELKQEEVIIVDKINGGTVAKQITGMDLKGLRMDEALFTNVFGGGTPW